MCERSFSLVDDSKEKDTQELSFREKILRQLEEGATASIEEAVVSPPTPEEEMFFLENDSSAAEETQIISPLEEEQEDSFVALEQTLIAPMPKAKSVKKQKTQELPSRLESRQPQGKGRQQRLVKRIVAVIVAIILFTLLATGMTGYFYIKSSLEPINQEATKTIQVEIPTGSTTKAIGNILVENKLIKNATIFNYYAKLKSYNNFQSGFYHLKQSMSVDDLAKALQEPGAAAPQDPIAGKVLIIEGYTLQQMAQAVTDNVHTKDKDDKTPFGKDEFLKTVQDPQFIQRMVEKYPALFANLPSKDSGVLQPLEGYLFPATYEYSNKTTIEELIEKMIAAMDANLQSYYEVLPSKGLDVNSLLTLASLVEKEGATDEDRRNIASVFYNRLNAGMPLQSNIAILYAMGKLGEKTTLAEDAGIDTQIDSPYNIYIHQGLMPGPVSTPSLSAIEATLNPNKTNYYYFVADVTTGTVYYSNSLEEHEEKVNEYVNKKLSE